MLWHLNYEINKEYYRDLFYRHVHEGKWHWTCKKQQRLYWFQLLCGREQDGFLREEIRSVEELINLDSILILFSNKNSSINFSIKIEETFLALVLE